MRLWCTLGNLHILKTFIVEALWVFLWTETNINSLLQRCLPQNGVFSTFGEDFQYFWITFSTFPRPTTFDLQKQCLPKKQEKSSCPTVLPTWQNPDVWRCLPLFTCRRQSSRPPFPIEKSVVQNEHRANCPPALALQFFFLSPNWPIKLDGIYKFRSRSVTRTVVNKHTLYWTTTAHAQAELASTGSHISSLLIGSLYYGFSRVLTKWNRRADITNISVEINETDI